MADPAPTPPPDGLDARAEPDRPSRPSAVAGRSGFRASFGVSIVLHGALLTALALLLRPWAAPSDGGRQDFLAQVSAPTAPPEPEPKEVVEAVAPPVEDVEVPEEPLDLPESPALPIEETPPAREQEPGTHLLAESVVYPRIRPGRRDPEPEARPRPAPAAERPAEFPAELPTDPQAAPAATPPSSPRPLPGQCPPPRYPPIAERRGWTGTVVLRIEVTAGGTVEQVHVERSSGHPVLDEAATRAVREWRFTPAMLGGRPRPESVRKPIRFDLPG